jgi:hypothetical protein
VIISTREDARNLCNAITRGVIDAGLSLCGAAARSGVQYSRLVSWVRLADNGVEPFAAWLLEVCRADAIRRLEELKTQALIPPSDAMFWRYRAKHGAPTELERELQAIRRLSTGKRAKIDARAELAALGPEHA